MNKKLTTVIFFSILSSVLQQNAMFRFSSNALKSKVNNFTQNFLELSDQGQATLCAVTLLSQIPLDKQLEERIFRLKTENGVNVRVMLGQQALIQQAKMIEKIRQQGAIVAPIPSYFRYFAWKKKLHLDGKPTAYLKSLNKNSNAQVALLSLGEEKQIAVYGKSRGQLVVKPESREAENCLRSLEMIFDMLFKRHVQ